MKIWYDDDPEVVSLVQAYEAFRNVADKSPIDGVERWARKNADALLDEIGASSWEERPVREGQRFLLKYDTIDATCIVTHVETRTNQIMFDLERGGDGALTYDETEVGEEVRWIDVDEVENIELIHAARNSEVDPRD